MAGITHFQEILKKKGKDFVEKLFDKYVTVNEKLDSLALSFEKNQYGKLDFFKRHTEVPISTIDRTLMKLYETPIYYIESLDQSIINKIPANWRFGMEYFTDENSQDISYDRLPKNNLILSYIHVKNSNGKVVRTIQSKDELDVWADLKHWITDPQGVAWEQFHTLGDIPVFREAAPAAGPDLAAEAACCTPAMERPRGRPVGIAVTAAPTQGGCC